MSEGNEPIDPTADEMEVELSRTLEESVEDAEDFAVDSGEEHVAGVVARERDAWDELAEGDTREDSATAAPSAQERAAMEAELGPLDESVEIEELEFLPTDQIVSILESVLFATDKPLSFHAIKQAFQGTSVKNDQIRKGLQALAVEYAGGRRGVTLEEVAGGYQLRTKIDNMTYLRRMVKQRPFKLSGPALEVLAIVAYKQPLVKSEVDQIRGVESGHLLRALMEKGLVNFAGKSDLPGKPMQYGTTRRFLEIFGLRNVTELPSLHEIDQLIPEGIDEGQANQPKTTLDELTGQLSESVQEGSFSVGEAELGEIAAELAEIETTTQFFEEERRRERERRDTERARDLNEALTLGESLDPKDQRWLEKYERELAMKALGEKAQGSETDGAGTDLDTAALSPERDVDHSPG